MKKRIVTICLVLCMLASMVVVPVTAAEGEENRTDSAALCPCGCGESLNACVWYEVITGDSCIGNTYRPVYMYEGEEIPLDSNITYEKLQEAAHKAVAQMRAEDGQA